MDAGLKMQSIQVYFGSETFNSQDLAERTVEAIAALGLPVELVDLDGVHVSELRSVAYAFIITSTTGVGDPPFNAEEFYETLMDSNAPRLENLRFSVCALGDRSYTDFCQCGRNMDAALERLGAQRVVPREDCDTDYEQPWRHWLDQVLSHLGALQLPEEGEAQAAGEVQAAGEAQAASEVQAAGEDRAQTAPAVVEDAQRSPPAVRIEAGAAEQPAPQTPQAQAPLGTRRQPWAAQVLDNRRLNRGGEKHTQHLRVSLEGSGLDYQPGDCLGVFAHNDEALILDVLLACELSPDAPVLLEGQWAYLHEALRSKLEITEASARLVELAAHQGAQRAPFEALLADGAAMAAYLAEHHVIDILQAARPQVSAAQLCAALRPLAPRSYSIASSPNMRFQQADLLVDVLQYDRRGRRRLGVASNYLAHRAGVGQSVSVYLDRTKHFLLPEDDTRPIIMVGPGTGVAPFRAFLQERELRGAMGLNWLFFGARHRATDYLYEDEIEGWKKSTLLSRLNLAFSRDQAEKDYVQHHMWVQRGHVWHWLEQGAYLYVCGDANQMAHDVHDTLMRIIRLQGGRSEAQAQAYVAQMRQEGRYLVDVY